MMMMHVHIIHMKYVHTSKARFNDDDDDDDDLIWMFSKTHKKIFAAKFIVKLLRDISNFII